MPRARQPKAAAASTAAAVTVIAVGDIVLASHAGQWDSDGQEPALVLKVGCEYTSSDNSVDNSTNNKDGVLVKFQVSNTRVVLPAAAVWRLEDTEDDAAAAVDGASTNKRRGRSSSRVSRSQQQTSPPPPQASKERKSRAMVTPSPTVAIAITATATSSGSDDTTMEDVDVEEEEKERPKKRGRSLDPKPSKSATASKKRAVSNNNPRAKAAKAAKVYATTKNDSDDDDYDDEGADKVESPYFARVKKTAAAAAAHQKPAAKKKKAAPAAASAKKSKAVSLADLKKAIAERAENYETRIVVQNSDDDDDDDSDDDDEDRPYAAEYASTGRATCKRCDELIAKGSLRISHVPLFRGKPGFKLYRHLDCIVFSEDITNVELIGGWKGIKRQSNEDYERLVLRVEESKLELEKEQEELQPDELIQVSFQGETRKPPPGLTANLLPFQTEGVSWMYHQEVKLPELRGGILADEMGMGKTVQTITTILDNRPKLQHSKPGAKHPPSATGAELEARVCESKLWEDSVTEWKHEMHMCNVPKKILPKKRQAARAGTLVICPVIALSQWKSELEKFTEPGTFTIATYHGPNRAKELPLEKLLKYDIILTTYQVMEQDFRKMVSPNKVACPNCGGKYKADKLRVHLKYFCGEGARKTEKQARQQRTADRTTGRGNGGGSGGGKGGSKGNLKKKEFSKATTKKANTTAAIRKRAAQNSNGKRSRAKPKQDESCDSEEEEEEEEDAEIIEMSPTGRPSRKAAVTASKLLSASMQEWTAGEAKGADEESFGDDGSESGDDDDDDESLVSYDEEDSEGEAIPSVPSKPTKKNISKKKLAKKAPTNSPDSDDSDAESSEEEDAALSRARNRQMAALEQAKRGKGGKKSFANAKSKGKKKKFDDDSSSDEESDDDVERDPLEGIDLDKLMREAMEGSRMSLLHSVCWWRIVLDEAHMIKSRNSSTAAAAFSLIGVNRWALSGTPLQNRVGELYSLIRFLRLEPMAHYFCKGKGCDCKSIHYRIKNGKCQDCKHGAAQHYSHFNKHVLNPIQRDGYSGDGRRAMFTLKNEVLDKCLLRRTKETRAEDMNLPPRIVSIRTIQLHPIEKDFYDALYTQTKSSFSDYVAQGTLLNNYAHIFDLLTKMRQAVDHPYLIVYSKRNCERAASADSGSQPQIANGSMDCDLCHEPPTERVVTLCCGAAYCRSCVMEYMTPALDGGGGGTPCPSCRAPFSIDLNQVSEAIVDDGTLNVSAASGCRSGSRKRSDDVSSDNGPSLKELPHVNSGSILRRINLAEFATSTKIEALVQELVQMRKTNPGSKALVFSQFVNMLDLIRWRLHCDPCLAEMGLGVRILHGSMDRKSRDAALKAFREDTSCRVLLMSLKSGGVALNLTVASHVYLVDNWWNPAAEMQAIDRTHRLGQHRVIQAVRFIAEGTVEERVLQLQEKKRLVFDGTVGRDAGSLKMLTANDMQSLFQ